MTAAQLTPFVDETYHVDTDIVKNYVNQNALLVSRLEKLPFEEVRRKMSNYFVPNTNGFVDRKFKLLEKNKYGDRKVTVKTSSEFLKSVKDNNYHLSPNMVAYKHSDEEQSINAIGTERFLKLRSVFKHKRGEAKADGDKDLYRACNEIQNALKIFNNAQSGAFGSKGTPLSNRTAHSTLSSTCRVLVSTANFLNEKIIMGNRFYNNYHKVLENFLSTIMNTDLKEMEKVIAKYEMNHATVDQVMDMVHLCSKRYWNNPARFNDIRKFCETLKPVELTAILCVLDIRGLYVTNEKMITKFFDDWCYIPEIPADAKVEDYEDPDNGDRYNLAISKLIEVKPKLEVRHLNKYHLELEEKYSDFIQMFFKAQIPPSGVYEIKDMIREAVVTSDTDSSIYSLDLVIERYTNDNNTGLRLNAVLTYFIRCVSVHQHALFSKNMNVATRHINRLTMKNEFLFGSYVTTLMSKHYFATQLMEEGVINKEVKLEIKGSNLRGSIIPKPVKDFGHKLMRDILDAIYEHRKLDPVQILSEVGDLERRIIKDINEGSWEWLTRKTIKVKEIYTKPASTVYRYHELWEEVFAEKYGNAPEPPYSAVKLNTNIKNKALFQEYLDSLSDKSIADKLTNYVEKTGPLTSMFVPYDILPRLGKIPDEIIQAADVRTIIGQNLKSIYVILEACGLYISNSNNTRFVSDEH